MTASVIGPVRILLCSALGLAAVAVLGACSAPAGTSATDQEAETIARKLSWPRQGTADNLVRAAVGTAKTPDESIVIQAEELEAEKLGEPMARLVFRFHHEGSMSGFISTDAVTACYEALFSYYGVEGGPERVDCPKGAQGIVPAPIPAKPNVVLPDGFEATLTNLLSALPAGASATDVKARITAGLPAPKVDPETGLRNLRPTVDAAVDGDDVGVSLRGGRGEDCLLGARIAGKVMVGRPSRIQLRPGELSCDAQTAIHFPDLRRPH